MSFFRSCLQLNRVISPVLFQAVNMSYMPSNCSRLNGKVAVVTASTEGIGYAIAARLADEGASVVVSSRKQKNVDSAVSQLKSYGLKGKVEGIVCHVGLAEDREKLLKFAENKFGGIDILVSNAAANPEAANLTMASEKAWDKTFEINVKAAFMLTKDVKPYLLKRGGGSIIYISSIIAYSSSNMLSVYGVTKTAMLGLTKAASLDLASDNVRVNAVAPGVIPTKFSSAITESDNASNEMLSVTPMRRFGKPEEIASVVAFLASEDASYMTGECVTVAGGMMSRL